VKPKLKSTYNLAFIHKIRLSPFKVQCINGLFYFYWLKWTFQKFKINSTHNLLSFKELCRYEFFIALEDTLEQEPHFFRRLIIGNKLVVLKGSYSCMITQFIAHNTIHISIYMYSIIHHMFNSAHTHNLNHHFISSI